jgi:stearoyl-CoA desaturase (delta-9 desaturase)
MGKVIAMDRSDATYNKNDKWNWGNFIGIGSFHVAALVGLFFFSWANLGALAVTWWITGSLGIGLGFHRMLTHRGFKGPRWFENFLAVCGSLALQGSPIAWVTTHRIHHKHTETENDPHSPRHAGGAYWAHLGWMMRGVVQGHNADTVKRYAPDLLKDNFLVQLSKAYWLTSVGLGIILFLIGGFSMVLWGLAVRVVVGWHCTWLVNSATHIWGTQRFTTGDDSTNNGLIALLTWGEGWHNNHHAHPSSARHGLAWYEFDWNWVSIKAFEKVGLIHSIKTVDLAKEMAKEEALAMRQAA